MADAATLADLGFVSGLEEAHKRQIAALGEVRDFAAGSTIFEQDAAATDFYALLEGEVDLVLVVRERVLRPSIDYEEAVSVDHEILEKPVVVETLRAGDVFGWSSLLHPPEELTAAARCRRASRVFSVPGPRLLELFERDPRLGYRFLERLVKVISQRLRHRTERLTEAWAEAFGAQHP